MGAKLAPTKSLVFSTCKTSSNWLKTHKWRGAGSTIKVISNCRDLVAHLCVSRRRKTGATFTKRLKKGRSFTEKVNLVKAPYHKKAAVVREKVLPMGLYGCETSPANESEAAAFRGAIADLLTYNATRRSVDLTFAIASHGSDLDPDIEIASRRVMRFRRSF